MTSYVKRIIIFSSASLLIALLLVVIIVVPLLRNTYKIFNDITGVKRGVASFNSETLEADAFDQEYNSLQITPDSIEQSLVSESAPIDLIQFLEDTAKDASLLIDISPVSVQKESSDPWNSIGFSVKLTGDFTSCMRFLEKIENSDYFIKAVKFDAKLITQKDVSLKRYEEFSVGQILTTVDFKVYTKQ
jgi:hypothetical protein